MNDEKRERNSNRLVYKIITQAHGGLLDTKWAVGCPMVHCNLVVLLGLFRFRSGFRCGF
jgi:hypothetical protein